MLKFPGWKLRAGMIAAVLAVCLMGAAGCGSPVAEAPDGAADPAVLFAYVGANLKEPVTELAAAFEAETGTRVELTFQNAGSLLNQIETTRRGDIYIPGGLHFAERAREQGHAEEIIAPLAYHTPVIVTPKDNPARIASVADLARPGVEVLVPDPRATAIGRAAGEVFARAGLQREIENNISATLESPARVLAAVAMGQGSAGIVEYSNTGPYRDELTVIEIDPALNVVDQIPVVSLVYARDPDLAAGFMRFAAENGPAVFEDHGFKIPG